MAEATRYRATVAIFVTITACLAAPLGGCTYLRYTTVQDRYKNLHNEAPSQRLAKHLLDRETYFVYGRLVDASSSTGGYQMSVVALSSRYRQDEIVEVNRLGKASSYYGMNLPEGDYRLLVVADMNRSGAYEQTEVVGERRVVLSTDAFPGKVAGGVDIALAAPHEEPIPALATLPAPPARTQAQESVFFPEGTIRSLDDPIFSDETGQMGIYDPAAFVEEAPMMFYALEEDEGYKVPVVFVHGIGGSPKQFAMFVGQLDRKRYKPWFFYYPGGEDLNQVARLFYDIFLSGKVIPDSGVPMVLVAHSMGGLVVREAMNLYGQSGTEVKVPLIITMATPFGGDPAAKTGVDRAPMVPPSWRDLDPGGAFITGLFRKPLPPSTAHHLIYAYRDKDDIARGSDGIVALSRQLPAAALAQATGKRGFKSEHTAILNDSAAISEVIGLIGQVKGPYPEEHLRYLLAGGFAVPLGASYSPRERYAIRNYGLYFRAIAAGKLEVAFPEQRHFIDVAVGRAAPSNDFETAWMKFRSDYPGLANANAQ